eukprot:Nk52_evm3s305 gene=Nk52_evmTU3s305
MRNIITFNTVGALLSVDLDAIKYSIKDEEVRLFCVTMEGSDFPEEKAKMFEKIHYAKKNGDGCLSMYSFNLDSARACIQSIYDEFNCETDNTWIITMNELNMEACATLRKEFGAKGGIPLESIDIFRDKAIMKKILGEEKLRIPKFDHIDLKKCEEDIKGYYQELKERIGLPLIIKPADGAGAAGVSKICCEEDMVEWWATEDFSEYTFEVEEFISGTLFHVDSAYKNGECIWTGIGEYLFPCFEFRQGKPLGSFVLLPESDLFKRLSKFSQECLAALGGFDGSFHMEVFRKEGTEELIFLEVGCRPGGADICFIHEKATGVPLPTWDFLIQCDMPVPSAESCLAKIEPQYISWAYMPKIAGKITKLIHPEEYIPYDVEILKKHFRVNVGDKCDFAEMILDYAAHIQFGSSDYEEVSKVFHDLHNYCVMETILENADVQNTVG